jgi:RNA polymerase sigma-70 factor (ECF subfamily)
MSATGQGKGWDVLDSQDRARFEQLVLPHLDAACNTCYTWLEKNRQVELMTEFDEDLHQQSVANPETLAIASDNRDRLARALESLPVRFREVIVLRELEGCSYKEIASITSAPIGTVMSALARARQRLQRALTQPAKQEAPHEL